MRLPDEPLLLCLSFHKHFSPYSHLLKKRGKSRAAWAQKTSEYCSCDNFSDLKYILHKTDAKPEGR